MRIVLFLLCVFQLYADSSEPYAERTLCYFMPPKGWEIADPRQLSPRVKMAFFKKSSKGFFPSLNLAIEEVDLSLSEYLKAVKAIHERDRKNQWRQLGKVRTQAGLAQLTEIDTTTEWGPLRILQLILIKDHCAYILTAAALKEEFSDFYMEIQTAFRSLTLTTDLFSAIPQLERRETLKQMQRDLLEKWENALSRTEDQENLWKPFEKTVVEKCEDLGAFWQVLLLQNTREKLKPSEPSIEENPHSEIVSTTLDSPNSLTEENPHSEIVSLEETSAHPSVE